MGNLSLLIKGGIVVTFDSKKRVFKDGAVAIQDDRIRAVGRLDEVSKGFRADRVINASRKEKKV